MVGWKRGGIVSGNADGDGNGVSEWVSELMPETNDFPKRWV
jgi:hypothetical protein